MTEQNTHPALYSALFPLFWGLLSVCLLICLAAPRAFAFAGPVIGLIFYSLYAIRAPKKPRFISSVWIYPLIILLLAFGSSLWALAPEETIKRSWKLISILIPGTLLILFTLSIPRDFFKKRHGVVLGGIFLFVTLCLSLEYLLDFPLYRLVSGLNKTDTVEAHVLNRSVVSVTILLFPVIFLVKRLTGKALLPIAVVFIAAYTPLLFLTDSQSALFAFAGGLLFFLFFPYRQKWLWTTFTFLVVFFFLAAPFLAIWAFDYADIVHDAPLMYAASAGNRLEIWDYVSRYALQNPLLGYGIEATRAVEAFDTQEIFQKGRTILHPHNVFLQIWIEFGLLGVIVFSGLIIHLFRQIGCLPPQDKKACIPGLVAALSVSLTGYGFWQSWWIGFLIFLTTISVLAIRAPDHSKSTGDSTA